ncbi:2-amino-4-hydroxy-6-hydroxymethyldihydropteridine diphosphokinase [Ensifer adhaerens]|uniref:2-amino-4-hydroxy-6- hydroxymethyldihydropteridine diphosphokinase n=1 Tax=Ensifer adhaerens TaxID=106592 RepID=UPI001CC09477|nr:2-amino-4-hydroxy-6-hydroxymethyldihydropteridine diphosphokinase [Ensifer adhaerens]MBZ7921848.1 2-amino-4-hydroxy-6-hydroxymethyldihydropteridine diphosphokinase [Ensifer adhaerens]UAX94247.1 2-amino-4-hydroxy-6-hydroxymethyldihydropteridine diphosphokinase [Ensifer adhaerens]UAY01882.1 2-amino-4-hydroxy-6-hydroxymethyldihydropteridine diphosphokinase [Ensifer adhaerens]UAY09265.1 2-amino-4-hydroxy-6-hydroxymethyldihydropteridine diphosphokinase [Ensifer adhaerens]
MSSETRWRVASLGLGGNLGDPRKAMAEALQALDARGDCVVEAVSRLYRTPPWGKTDQAWFFNACAQVRTTLEPEALLNTCLDIERSMKRVRDERWGPRTLDIDVLTYEGVAQADTRLELPHPRMTDRGFVLMPLADFAADLLVRGRTVGDWLREADIAGIEVADGDMTWWRAVS